MKQKIKDFSSGQTDQIHLIIMNVEGKTTKSGADYVTLTMSDGDQVITGNLFDKKADTFEFPIGCVVEARLEAKTYNNALIFNIHGCRETDEDPESFIPHAPIAAETMYQSIYKFAEEKLGVYSSVTTSILEEYKESLMVWTAAKKIHHNIRGGLLYHMYRMLKTASYLAGCYSLLDKCLLCAGTILHDIGKIKEMECDMIGSAVYTADGNLFGHLLLGAEIIEEHARKVGMHEEETRLLKHMIISHHGKPEYGAVKTPAIPEAAVLFHIDNMDAEIYQYEEAMKNLKPGETSDILYGLNTRVYHRK